MKKADAVVNFAAESHVDRSIQTPSVFVETNVLGVQVPLEACRKSGVRFEQISTDEAYDSRVEGSSVETDVLSPSSPHWKPRTYYSTHIMSLTDGGRGDEEHQLWAESASGEAQPKTDHKRATWKTPADIRD